MWKAFVSVPVLMVCLSAVAYADIYHSTLENGKPLYEYFYRGMGI